MEIGRRKYEWEESSCVYRTDEQQRYTRKITRDRIKDGKCLEVQKDETYHKGVLSVVEKDGDFVAIRRDDLDVGQYDYLRIVYNNGVIYNEVSLGKVAHNLKLCEEGKF